MNVIPNSQTLFQHYIPMLSLDCFWETAYNSKTTITVLLSSAICSIFGSPASARGQSWNRGRRLTRSRCISCANRRRTNSLTPQNSTKKLHGNAHWQQTNATKLPYLHRWRQHAWNSLWSSKKQISTKASANLHLMYNWKNHQ